MSEIIICADDYAISPGVGQAIRELIQAKRINATSVMATTPWFAEQATELDKLNGDASIGLHLTLTDQPALTMGPLTNSRRQLPRLRQLIKQAFTKRLPLSHVRREINAQLDQFEAQFGRAPDHIDGHQHVQQLPGIREILLNTVKLRYGEQSVLLRSSHDRLSSIFLRNVCSPKTALIALIGKQFHKLLIANHLQCNDSFSGIYSLKPTAHFQALFQQFLKYPQQRHIIMCHPGYVDEALISVDSVTWQRQRELEYLMSDAYQELLTTLGYRYQGSKFLVLA